MRGLTGWIALAVPLALAALAAAAWIDAGREPVGEIVIPVPVPELPR